MRKTLSTQATKEKVTPQRERARADQVVNNAGGYTFEVTPRVRLERFLILGTTGGTYYVGESKLTQENTDFVKTLIAQDEALVVSTVLDVRRNNRAAKQSPAIFVTAMLMCFGRDKATAKQVVSEVCKTSTQLFEYAEYVDKLGGWGSAKRDSVAQWYLSKTPEQVAFQAIKYRQRNSWTHRDMLRLSHPVGLDQTVGNFILGKNYGATEPEGIIRGFERIQAATTVTEAVKVLDEFPSLPWETIPTQFLNDKRIWEKLFHNGAIGQTALLRNVTRLAKIGAFDDLVFARDAADALASPERIAKGRMHPVAYANALGIYRDGKFESSGASWYNHTRSKDWDTTPAILDALEAGFYESFKTVEPANKRTMIALDVSSSMEDCSPAGLVGLTCRDASALMAMVTIRTEPYTTVKGFSTSLRNLSISPRDSLGTVVNKVSGLPFGGTDCALPMVYAKQEGLEIDTFVVYTDSETWAGRVQPFQALKEYRRSSGIDARLVVVGMVATNFSIADPQDRGMLDVCGLDSSAPAVISNFSAGRV